MTAPFVPADAYAETCETAADTMSRHFLNVRLSSLDRDKAMAVRLLANELATLFITFAHNQDGTQE